jgi:putative ABC transport system ATP-binding protein
MVTHEPEMAAFAHRIIHFRDGLVERMEQTARALGQPGAPNEKVP